MAIEENEVDGALEKEAAAGASPKYIDARALGTVEQRFVMGGTNRTPSSRHALTSDTHR